MLSHQQIEIKKQQVKLVIDSFLKYKDITIDELSKIIGVSSSSIQRYLNDVEYIELIYGTEAKTILEKVSEKLKKNKNDGLSKGGINSTTNNVPIRDENGKFTGNKKR